MSWATSPACTELETLDGGLDGRAARAARTGSARTGAGGGVIQGTRVRGHAVRHPGRPGAGHRRARQPGRRSRRPGGLRHVAGPLVDREGRAHRRHRQRQPPRRGPRRALAMRPDALAAAIAEDRAAGPAAVLRLRHRRHHLDHGLRPGPRASAAICRPRVCGCTSTRRWRHRRAVPRAALGQRRAGPGRLLLHQPAQVDGGELRLRPVLGGRPGALLSALSILPEYLRTAAGEAGAVIDYRDWQIPLGRRFRALKLWFTLRCDGVDRSRP